MGVIIGFTVFASCPPITGGYHHRFDCFCKLSSHYRWLPSYVLLCLQVVLSLQVAAIIGLTCFLSCLLIKAGCHHRFDCFSQVVLSYQMGAVKCFTFLQIFLSLQVGAITGLTVFASCPVITGGYHHRFDCFWKNFVLSLQVAAIIGVLQVVLSLQVGAMIGFTVFEVVTKLSNRVYVLTLGLTYKITLWLNWYITTLKLL